MHMFHFLVKLAISPHTAVNFWTFIYYFFLPEIYQRLKKGLLNKGN